MELLYNVNLKKIHTFGIECTAKVMCVIDDIEQLPLLKNYMNQFPRYLILGGGSNVLFIGNYDGLLIKNELKGIEIVKETEKHVYIKAYSGENWHEFVTHAVQNNWGGIENLSLIPGTVGASPIQNIGAYGVEVKDTLIEVEVYDLNTQSWRVFKNKECHFGYRDSIFKEESNKGRYFITSVTFKLEKNPQTFKLDYGDIRATLEELYKGEVSVSNISHVVIHIRERKLPNPNDIGNAGSFFKNPVIDYSSFIPLKQEYPTIPHYLVEKDQVKIPAAWLIEQCGWKGLQVGKTGNHTQQALVIVNYGQASGEEVKKHSENVQKSVLEKFGIELEREVSFI